MDNTHLTADALRQWRMDHCINCALWNAKNYGATYARDSHYLKCRFPPNTSGCNATLFRYGAKTRIKKDYGIHVFHRDLRLDNFYHPILYFPDSRTPAIPF